MSESSSRDREVVGVLGGTFDPVHLGHLHAARGAARELRLGRVLLVPCAVPPHKPSSEVLPAAQRVAMLRVALRGEAGLDLCTIEIERAGPSYTIDTLRALKGGSPPVDPVFILGFDALLEIETWHRHEDLVREFDLAAIDRPDRARGPVAGLPPSVARRIVSGSAGTLETSRPGGGGRIFRLALPPLGVSSSEVRERARAGEPLAGLVPPAVARYIQAERLYRQEGSR